MCSASFVGMLYCSQHRSGVYIGRLGATMVPKKCHNLSTALSTSYIPSG